MAFSHPTGRLQSRPCAFTLVELLVVIAIVSLLLALTLPSLQKSRLVAQQMACMSNQRQMGVAAHAYANNERDLALPHNTEFPNIVAPNIDHITNRAHWMKRLIPYMLSGESPANYSPISGTATSADRHVKAFLCPLTGSLTYNSSTGRCYTWNAAITTGRADLPTTSGSYYAPVSLGRMRAPQSNVVLVAEAGHYGSFSYSFIDFTLSTSTSAATRKHHDYAINYLFIDGHAESLRKGDRSDIMMGDKSIYGW